MIDHVSLPVADYARSRAFYDRCLGALGYKRVIESAEEPDYIWCGYAEAEGAEPPFCVGASSGPGGRPPTATPEGQHIAFTAPDRAAVDSFHKEALLAGGRDNGAPGLRPQYHPNYYAAFVLDPDGHRIEAVCHRPDSVWLPS
jgi:catechol 2,3-dioxygenase-like lactoylglutathione lyase family enzyme